MRSLVRLSLFIQALVFTLLADPGRLWAQVPGMDFANGIPRDVRTTETALIHAKLWITPERVIADGELAFREGKVTYAGPTRATRPATVQVLDAKGKTIYPAFVEMISDIGLPPVAPAAQGFLPPQYDRGSAGARYWNEHIHPETRAALAYRYDEAAATAMRKMGFGYALTHQRDGIARGSAAMVALAPDRLEKKAILKADAAQAFSFERSKASRQEYPGSLMGGIALLRQMYLDLAVYRSEQPNQSLEALRAQAALPAIFEAGAWQNVLRAAKVAQEAGRTYILRGAGDEYHRLAEIKALRMPLIVPVGLPKAYDVADPLDADLLELKELMHYERAPYNLSVLQTAGVPFAITTAQLKDKAEFWPNLRRQVKAGLPEAMALRALTAIPANLLGMQSQLGTLEVGKLASFVVADKSLFISEGQVQETWVAGERFVTTEAFGAPIAGTYKFGIGADSSQTLTITTANEATLRGAGADTAKRKLTLVRQDNWVTMAGKLAVDTSGITRLSGYFYQGRLSGQGRLPKGQAITWQARRTAEAALPPDTARVRPSVPGFGLMPYPFAAYGNVEVPKARTILYRNATLWTNETSFVPSDKTLSDSSIVPGTANPVFNKLKASSVLQGYDLLVEGGKIAVIGKSLKVPTGAEVVDATGRHITPGIIDEHSHIAIQGGVNECSHSVTSEVRVGDVINSEDPNIYRHLAGGVVAVQQLHGSCNTIGGQSSLIKLRWGQAPEALKIAGADGFIKCALGENVKQSNFGDLNTLRYPQTRMGVEQVFKDAFARARAYEADQKAYTALPTAQRAGKPAPRRDLQLEAVLEILNRRRFITCHSYVASEIAMLMRVADSAGFKVNTFTHILEGYKVADLMKAHGAGASTFADWWYYKMEVRDAIPYNAAILTRVGVTTAINSDDAEMGRRLNQEAAKTVRYGGLSEEEALATITINPAKLLHLDKRMGSLKVGKDADIVLWSGHPLSAGAHALRTTIEGAVYFDAAQDSLARIRIQTEKTRLIRLVMDEKSKGAATQPATPPKRAREWHCDDADSRDESWGVN